MSTDTLSPRRTGAPTKPKKDGGIQIAPEATKSPPVDRILWDLASKIEGVGGKGWATGEMQENPLVFDNGLRLEHTRPTKLAPIKWHLYDKSKRTRGKGVELWMNDEKIIGADNNLTSTVVSSIDHGGLSGLGDAADHTWAALVDGSRDITGLQDFNSSLRLKESANTLYLTLAQAANATRTITFPDATTTLAGLSVAQTFTAKQDFATSSGIAAQFGTTNTTSDIVVGELAGATSYSAIGLQGALGFGTGAVAQANLYMSSGDTILYINNRLNGNISFRINNVDAMIISGTNRAVTIGTPIYGGSGTNLTFVTSTAGGAGILFATGDTVTYTQRFRIDGATGNIGMAPATKLYLDGVGATGDTYLHEVSADQVELFAGAVKMMTWDEDVTDVVTSHVAFNAESGFQLGGVAVTLTAAQINDAALKGAANTFTAVNTFNAAGGIRILDGGAFYAELGISGAPAGNFTVDFPSSSFVVAGSNIAQTFSAINTFTANPIISGATPTLHFVDTTAAEDDWDIYVDGNRLRFKNVTDGFDRMQIDGGGQVRLMNSAGTFAHVLLADATADRITTFPNEAMTLAGRDVAQTFSAINTFTANPIISGATPTLHFVDTTAAEDDWDIYVDGNRLRFKNVTDGFDRMQIDGGGQVRLMNSAGTFAHVLLADATADRITTFPNEAMTLAGRDVAQTFSAINTFTAASGIRFQDGQASLGGILKLDTITTGDKTFTFPNKTGNVSLKGVSCWTFMASNSTVTETSTAYVAIAICTTSWPGASFQNLREAYFEAVFGESGTDVADVELYNNTAATSIAVLSTEASQVRGRSADIASSLTDDIPSLQVRIRNRVGSSITSIWAARLILVW